MGYASSYKIVEDFLSSVDALLDFTREELPTGLQTHDLVVVLNCNIDYD